MLYAFLPLVLASASVAQPAPPPPVVPPAAIFPPIRVIEVKPPGNFVTIAKQAQPLAPLETYYTPADYPAAALAAGQEGRTEILLVITPQGRVGRCLVTRSSGSAVLDHASCAIATRRARFAPALDVSGKPVFGTTGHAVAWKL